MQTQKAKRGAAPPNNYKQAIKHKKAHPKTIENSIAQNMLFLSNH